MPFLKKCNYNNITGQTTKHLLNTESVMFSKQMLLLKFINWKLLQQLFGKPTVEFDYNDQLLKE